MQDGDCYGYQITQSICDKSMVLLRLRKGHYTPILYRLVDKGYLTDYKKPAGKRLMRVYYHLEETGVIYFHELLEEYNQVKLGVELILSQNQSSSEIAMGGENIEQKN